MCSPAQNCSPAGMRDPVSPVLFLTSHQLKLSYSYNHHDMRLSDHCILVFSMQPDIYTIFYPKAVLGLNLKKIVQINITLCF